jgi:gas vesicle protein
MMRYMCAALCGATIGAGVALLFAPKTGRATRAMIKDKANRYAHDVQDYVGSKARHLRNKATGYRHMAGDTVDEMMGRGQDLIDQGKEAMGIGSSNTSQDATHAAV